MGSILTTVDIQILAIVITVQSFLQISPSITTITRNNPRTPSPISSRYDTILSVNPSDDMHHTHPEDNDEHANNREIQNLVVPNRRNFLSGTVASVAATAGMITNPQSIYAATTSTVTSFNIPSSANDLSWPLGKVAFSLIPLAGTSSRRATVEECVVPNTIWTHDQLQGVVNVNVPVRQTVIKLSEKAGGGLFVHNPVAPTPQVIKMMRALEEKHGPVRHIVLGTVRSMDVPRRSSYR